MKVQFVLPQLKNVLFFYRNFCCSATKLTEREGKRKVASSAKRGETFLSSWFSERSRGLGSEAWTSVWEVCGKRTSKEQRTSWSPSFHAEKACLFLWQFVFSGQKGEHDEGNPCLGLTTETKTQTTINSTLSTNFSDDGIRVNTSSTHKHLRDLHQECMRMSETWQWLYSIAYLFSEQRRNNTFSSRIVS